MTLVLIILGNTAVNAQNSTADARVVNQKGMTVLASWSVLNIAANSALLFTKPTSEQQGFYGSNIAWNAVNGVLAFSGLRKLSNDSFSDSYTKKLKKAFAINTFIDIGYIAAGGAMALHKKSSERTVGVGKSIALQGAFLLVFDAIMWQTNTRFTPVLQTNAIGFQLTF